MTNQIKIALDALKLSHELLKSLRGEHYEKAEICSINNKAIAALELLQEQETKIVVNAAKWRHSVEREKIMMQWDSWCKTIKSSGASWAREAFECLLDDYDEKLESLQAQEPVAWISDDCLRMLKNDEIVLTHIFPFESGGRTIPLCRCDNE